MNSWRQIFGIRFLRGTIAGWITPDNRILTLSDPKASHISELKKRYPQFSNFDEDSYEAIDDIFDQGFVWFSEDPGATTEGVVGVQCHPSRMQDAVRILKKIVGPPAYSVLDFSLWNNGAVTGRKIVSLD